MTRLVSLVAFTLLATACAGALNPRQELTWDAYKACVSEGSTTNLEHVLLDGSWRLLGREMEVFAVNRCMSRYMEQAAREGRVPPLPPSVTIERPRQAAAPGLIAAAPTWVPGDRWNFQSESPSGTSRFSMTVDREEPVADGLHYVLKSGRRERFHRKTDLAYSQETLDGRIVARSIPAPLQYVWPLVVGTRWEQTYREERPAEGQTYDLVEIATVEAEETITVPGGTFRTLRIVRRSKATKEIRWQEWYAPDVKMWVRWRDRTSSGARERQLTSYTLH